MSPRTAAAAVFLLSTFAFPTAVDADVDVVPDGLNPNLGLKATKWEAGGRKRASIGGASARPVRQRKDSACFFNNSRVSEQRFERTYRCGARGITATDAQPATAPQVTEGDIRRAVSEIPMPSLQIQVQPGERTLVNVPTIFHTDPRTLRESVTLLGFDIEVEATPTRYTWHPGDGTSKSTTKPGRPYPAKDVTHTYRRVANEVRPRVDTTYSVRYRVDGGAWTPLGQTLTAQGAPTSLEVEEAAPVLVTP